MQNKPEIWLLLDNRPGTSSQAIALANYINIAQHKFYLDYNYLANLPNFTFGIDYCLFRLKNKHIFKNLNYFPSHIISAGRRTATFALYLQKQAKKKGFALPKIIQIMHPKLPLHLFDWIILPKHDHKPNLPKNVLFSLGGLANFDNTKIRNISFDNTFLAKINQNQPIIALLIGGSFAKKQNFSLEIFLQLYNQISSIVKKMQAQLIVLNSKRTSSAINNFLQQQTNVIFHDWHQSGSDYYLQTLALANFLVITGDSVSMISESLSTGKPVYIFSHPHIIKNKHNLFHQQLQQENLAQILLPNQTRLTKYSYLPLNEAHRLSKIIFK